MRKKRGSLSFSEALDLVPDDVPDGAAWAMAEEMAGFEPGDADGSDLLDEDDR
jgi:hypothetical protein